jgi:NADH-quinone oxidoreductase subunit B
MALEQLADGGVMLTQLDRLANWVRKNSLWPMPFATACCGIEVMATGASRHDIARFGAEAMRFSPRQCDLMIVAGRIVMKMLPVLQRIWLQMPEPKWCISMGACASSGGVFDTYAVVQGVDRFLPVDVYIPGCPPRPEQVLQSVIDLQDKIQRTGTVTGKEFTRRTAVEGPRPLAPVLPPAEALVAPGNFASATRLQGTASPHREEGIRPASDVTGVTGPRES